jgi:hypothetical protein
MALSQRSLILYGFEINSSNRSIDFKESAIGAPLQATLKLGYYSLTSLLAEVVRALQAAGTKTYAATADRTVMGGLQNRVTITSLTGTYFSLLFGTGTRAASSAAVTLGFLPGVDRTGALTYTGVATAGTSFMSTLVGYNYLAPEMNIQIQGARAVSATGVKEAITFPVMNFLEVEYKYEPNATILGVWVPFFKWAVAQRRFEITPEYGTPNTFYEVTLDKTEADASNGMAWKPKELLPQYPNFYTTGKLTLRQLVQAGQFII